MIRIGDTRYPVGPPSGGSMTTASITPAARNAAYQLKREFFEAVAPQLNVSPADLYFAGGKLRSKSNSSLSLSLRQAAAKLKSEELSARANRMPDYGGPSDARRPGGERRTTSGRCAFCRTVG